MINPFSMEEFSCALHQMHPDKALGLDGFNAGFYRCFWGLSVHEIFSACTFWLDRGSFPLSLNETNIVLIPNCHKSFAMTELRPISLCSVIYKLIVKVLANRFKKVLPKCISEERSAFVEGMSILNNAFMAIKAIHSMKNRRKGKLGDMALKIDISKAYDRVDCGFLNKMLGFS